MEIVIRVIKQRRIHIFGSGKMTIEDVMNVIIVRVEDIVLNARMVRLLLRMVPAWELAENALHAPMMSANFQVNINVSHVTALGMMIQKNVKNKKKGD